MYPLTLCNCSKRGCDKRAHHWVKIAPKTYVPVCTPCRDHLVAIINLAKKPK